MSDDARRHADLSEAEIARRIRDLEREALAAQPPARVERSLPEGPSENVLEQEASRRRQADDSLGPLVEMLAGLALIGGGLYLYASRLVVWSGFWGMFRRAPGGFPVGLLFVPFILGVALVVTGSRALRLLGSALVVGSFVAFVGISLASVGIYFRPTPFLDVLAMFALVGVGLGLTVRAVKRL